MGAYREMWKLIKQDYIVNQWIVLHINELEGGVKLLNILKVLIHSRGFCYTFWLRLCGGGRSFKTFLLVDIASSVIKIWHSNFTSDAIRRRILYQSWRRCCH